MSLSTIFNGAIATHVRGGGVDVGLVVTSEEIEGDIEFVREGVTDSDGEMPIVPAKL